MQSTRFAAENSTGSRPADAGSEPPLHNANDLTRGGNLAYIQLADQLYTLRITRAGKLILTK